MSVWKRIDAWLARKAPGTLAALHPGAEPDAIAAFEKALGRSLPLSMRTAYEAHDGAIDEMAITIFGALRSKPQHQWLRMMCWLPLSRALEQLRFVQTLGEKDWPDVHLPIALDAGGNLLLLDLDSEAILLWDHETWDPEEVATSFEAWITMLADDMDAKLVIISEDEDDETALELLDMPVPSLAVPSLKADRAARVLLSALLERRWIELAKDADPEPLVRELLEALSASPKARSRAVSNVLERSKSVDELFADDEQIADLVEEIG